MFEQILVPTDGSEAAGRAVDLALDIAETYDSGLHTVYVVDIGSLAADEDSDGWLIERALEADGERAITEVRERAVGADIPVESGIRYGRPYKTILQYVDDNDIDLVVLGTHGRRGLDHYLLGSVTERVVRTAPVPVLTVRATDRPATE
ncbi:universal stress protein [Haloarcula onubensis]|uniref:Universal stress protein n=1 Tax=Haloarcula onubensis TaxID=2950539 RepID=A0ABU2FPN4_9EURY|nr:universal stress protein [Halomicroarcula sp. S3CR25-11]MDS0282710.1 universal stress protein [Halomicroarcula sp. S3CR25-11]